MIHITQSLALLCCELSGWDSRCRPRRPLETEVYFDDVAVGAIRLLHFFPFRAAFPLSLQPILSSSALVVRWFVELS